jgi:hypothetical protein
MRWIVWIVIAGCGGSQATWITQQGNPPGAGSPPQADAKLACAAVEHAAVTQAPSQCCVGAPSIGASSPVRDLEACKPPVAPTGQIAVLACVPGDPSGVTGIHRLPDGLVAILTEASTVCGGVARATSTAWWVVIPADAPAAMASCKVTHEDCSGPPRP